MYTIDQKRVAKNAMLLFIRMGLVMAVGFYTSRIILDALGETDFGIYNLIGGIVSMFAVLGTTMSSSCQRFYNHEMGSGNMKSLRQTFSLFLVVFLGIMIVVFCLCESLGLWLLQHKMDVNDKLDAARWVLQCSIFSLCITIVRYPFQGMIIAKEKMKAFAYLSIVEALGQLGIAFLISHSSTDRLKLYAIAMLCLSVTISLYYIVYCILYYPECRYTPYWNKKKFVEVTSFAGWNIIGSLAWICKNQGINIIINPFGIALNAAYALAYKVYTSIQQFVSNFFVAIQPQIIKSYATGKHKDCYMLVNQSSRLSFFLMLMVSLPIFLETPFLLNIWLKDVPQYTVLFTRLTIINTLVDVLATPLAHLNNAYGKIRNYQLVCGGLLLLILPVSWLFLKHGYPVHIVFIVSIITSTVAVIARAYMVHIETGFELSVWFNKTIKPIFYVTILSFILPLVLEYLIVPLTIRFFVVSTVSVISVSFFTWVFGMTSTERKHSKEFVLSKFNYSK